MRPRSLSNSIAVDLMATEKIEDTDNLTSCTTDVVSCNCVSYTDSYGLEPQRENASLFAWSAGKKSYEMTVVNLSQVTVFALNLYFLQLLYTLCSCTA